MGGGMRAGREIGVCVSITGMWFNGNIDILLS